MAWDFLQTFREIYKQFYVDDLGFSFWIFLCKLKTMGGCLIFKHPKTSYLKVYMLFVNCLMLISFGFLKSSYDRLWLEKDQNVHSFMRKNNGDDIKTRHVFVCRCVRPCISAARPLEDDCLMAHLVPGYSCCNISWAASFILTVRRQ